ncbi:MAG: response regulator [Burkholderiales bacterium]|nr:response regulator [Burkholderiales bacterium]
MAQSENKKTILLVDDSASLRQVVHVALAQAGYEVIEAADGVEGLARLDGRRIHLIISDVNMPKMDGISFVRAVKQNRDYRFTPIVMLTTEAQEDRRLEGQMAGAKAWVVKPFRAEQMLKAVAKLILP